jgi:hypothetical protein
MIHKSHWQGATHVHMLNLCQHSFACRQRTRANTAMQPFVLLAAWR